MQDQCNSPLNKYVPYAHLPIRGLGSITRQKPNSVGSVLSDFKNRITSRLAYSVADTFSVSVKNEAILKEADISTDTAVTPTISFQFCTANTWPEGDWRVLNFPSCRLVNYPSQGSLYY